MAMLTLKSLAKRLICNDCRKEISGDQSYFGKEWNPAGKPVEDQLRTRSLNSRNLETLARRRQLRDSAVPLVALHRRREEPALNARHARALRGLPITKGVWVV